MDSEKSDEEVYFLVWGKGEFEVEGRVLGVEEGRVVRVCGGGKGSVGKKGRSGVVMVWIEYWRNRL